MINIRYTSLYIIADKNCISAGWIIPGHVTESCGNEINFAECRCKFYFCRAWLPSPPAFTNKNILMNIPSLPSNLESSTLFLNKFSCGSEEISRNYRPAMNIHNDRTLRIRGHVYYSRRGRVWMSRDGFNWISNRKRIVKTRFGYALFEGRCVVKRRGLCACTLGTLCHCCYHFLFLWSDSKEI